MPDIKDQPCWKEECHPAVWLKTYKYLCRGDVSLQSLLLLVWKVLTGRKHESCHIQTFTRQLLHKQLSNLCPHLFLFGSRVMYLALTAMRSTCFASLGIYTRKGNTLGCLAISLATVDMFK